MTTFHLRDLILFVSLAICKAGARNMGPGQTMKPEIEATALLMGDKISLPASDLALLAAYLDKFLREYPLGVTFEHENGINQETLDRVCPEEAESYTPEEITRIATIMARIIDHETAPETHHSERIAARIAAMADYYGKDPKERADLVLAASLHDVGKILIPRGILLKPTSLSDDEFNIMRKHAYYTHAILHSVRGLNTISSWAYRHHEKLDGSGYPYGLDGSVLGQEERLLACVDIYEALAEARSYKPTVLHADIMKIMRGQAQAGLLDRDIVDDIDHCFA